MSIKKDLKRFLALSPLSKLGVFLILLFSLFLGIGAVCLYWHYYLPEESPPFFPKTVSTLKAPKKASFSLIPQNMTVSKGETFSVGVNLDSGDYRIEAADCVFAFDPKVLSVIKVSPGLFFAEYPKKETKDGKILLTGTIGVTGKQKGGVKGQASFGSIKFKALKTGSVALTFLRTETIVASGGENILGEVKDGVYLVNLVK